MHTMPAWKHAQAAKPLNFVAAASDEQESVVVECNIRLAVLYKLYAFATSSQVFPGLPQANLNSKYRVFTAAIHISMESVFGQN